MQILRVLAVLKRAAQRPASPGIAKGRRVPLAPVLPTGDLINRLSQERLMLYREVSGHPLPRAVRARLGEIVRELDRLWDLRRRELAGLSWLIEVAATSKVTEALKAADSPKVNGTPKSRNGTSRKSPVRRPPGVPAPVAV